MTTPIRLQLSRRRGFDLQAHSLATNGLPAVNVARPGKWGNPYSIAGGLSAAECVEAYRDMMILSLDSKYETRRTFMRHAIAELHGKNLACWCKPGAPCHADVLLEFANHVCEETT